MRNFFVKPLKIRKMLAKGMCETENSTFHLVHYLLAIEIKILFLKLTMALNSNFNVT